MDNAIKRARNCKKEKYRDIIKQHREANPDIKVHYKVLVLGVIGAIHQKLEIILTEITPRAQTDWIITQIHRALLVYNHAIWVERNKYYNSIQAGNLQLEELDSEFDEEMDIAGD